MHSCTGLRRESVLGGATGGAPRRRGSIRGIGTLLAMPSRGRQPVERSISVQHRLCTGWRRNPWHENHTSGTRHVSCRRPVAQQEYCYCEAYLPGAAKGQGGRGGLAWGETLARGARQRRKFSRVITKGAQKPSAKSARTLKSHPPGARGAGRVPVGVPTGPAQPPCHMRTTRQRA